MEKKSRRRSDSTPGVPLPGHFPEWADLDPLLRTALDEDLGGSMDVTSAGTLTPDHRGTAELVMKESGIVAGLPLVERLYRLLSEEIQVSVRVADGSHVRSGAVIACLNGPVIPLLEGERTILNFLQRLSGIATMTALFVQAVRGTGAVILDTRKTTPCLRKLEKYAVQAGGGVNHRMGLFDMVLIKDNHIDAAGSITRAVSSCIEFLKRQSRTYRIEVETRSLDDVREVLGLPVDRIMLDNMDIPTMKKAVDLIDGALEVEASGNVNLDTVRDIAETGVDFISVGALTHSVRSLDISMRIRTERSGSNRDSYPRIK